MAVLRNFALPNFQVYLKSENKSFFNMILVSVLPFKQSRLVLYSSPGHILLIID